MYFPHEEAEKLEEIDLEIPPRSSPKKIGKEAGLAAWSRAVYGGTKTGALCRMTRRITRTIQAAVFAAHTTGGF